MRTFLRRLICASVAAFSLLALAGFAATRLIDVDTWRDEVAAALTARTGFDVRIAGRLRVIAGLRPSLLVRGIEVRSASDPTADPLMRIAAMEFEADLLRSYREQRLVLNQARATGVDVALVRDASGAGNWQLPDRAAPRPDAPRTAFTRFTLERVVLEDAQLRYETAVSDWAFDLDIRRLDIEAPERGNRIGIDAHGSVQQHPFELRIGATTDPTRSAGWLGPGAAIDVSSSARIGPLELAAAGRLTDPRGKARADLAISLHLDRVEQLADFLTLPEQLDVADLGAADIRAQLVGGDGRVRLDDVVVSLDLADAGRAEGRGRVGDLVRAREIELDLTLSTSDAGSIARRLGLPTPRAGAATGTSQLRIDGLDIHFDDIVVDARHPLGAALRVRGDVRGTNPGWAANLDFEVDAAKVVDLERIIEEVASSTRKDGAKVQLGRPGSNLQKVLMEIGPLRARGRLEGSGKQWAMNRIEGDAGTGGTDWLRATGRIASLAPSPTGIRLDLEAGSEDFTALAERAAVPVVGLQRMRVQGRIVGDTERIVLTRMQAVASTPDRITVGITGDLPIGDDWLDTNLLVAISANDLSTFGDVIERSFPRTAALELSALVRAEGDALVAEDMVVGLGNSVVSGRLRIEPGVDRPRILADLHSASIELRDIGLAPAEEEAGDAAARAAAVPWYDDPIPFEELLDADGTFSLKLDRLVGRAGFDIADIRLRAGLARGVLTIDDLRLAYQGGQALVSIRVDAAASPPELDFKIAGQDFSIERVLAQFQAEPVARGVGELNGRLHARGRNARALGASVTGNVLLVGANGGLSMRYSRALQLDIGPRAARRAARGEFEQVECLVVDAVAASPGQISLDTMFLDTEDKQVLGSGWIDLRTHRINVLLTPVLKQAIPGSVAAAVRINGTLYEPNVSAAALATASAAAQGLVDRALLPLNRVLPAVGGAVDDLRRGADRALAGTGVTLPTAGLWRPGIDLTCERLLQSDRIRAARRGAVPPAAR